MATEHTKCGNIERNYKILLENKKDLNERNNKYSLYQYGGFSTEKKPIPSGSYSGGSGNPSEISSGSKCVRMCMCAPGKRVV